MLTRANADAAVDAYLKAFVLPTGTTAFIKGDQNGGDPGFWQEVEEIEGIEDANDRSDGKYNTQVSRAIWMASARRTEPIGPAISTTMISPGESSPIRAAISPPKTPLF